VQQGVVHRDDCVELEKFIREGSHVTERVQGAFDDRRPGCQPSQVADIRGHVAVLGHVPVHVVLGENPCQFGQGDVPVSPLWAIRRLPRQGDPRSIADRSVP